MQFTADYRIILTIKMKKFILPLPEIKIKNYVAH